MGNEIIKLLDVVILEVFNVYMDNFIFEKLVII